ncbi:hypothetical protein HDV02_002164 [Globomyces sp. JEL0801]|nr:hypothetical protein HDV02_002164 [Globomyces sp. JEL0801]
MSTDKIQNVEPETEKQVESVTEDFKTEIQELDSKKEIEVEVEDADFVSVKLTKAQFISVFVSLAFAVFLVALDGTIVTTAIKAIGIEFGDFESISWVGTGFLLTSTALTPAYGSFCDTFGRKPTFLAAILFFEIGSFICAIAPSMAWLIAGRAVAGIGGGGIFAVALIIISDIVSIRESGKYQGIIGAVFGLSSVVGPLAGGFFVDSLSWRWCFWINLPIGFITIIITVLYLNFPTTGESVWSQIHRVDFLGTFLIIAASTSFLLPLQLGGSKWEWGATQTIVLFIASVVLCAVLVFIEVKVAKHPVIPPQVFENPSVYLLNVIAFLLGLSFISLIFYVPTFFQLVNGSTATSAGLSTIPLVFGLVALSILSGILISKYGSYKYWLFIGPAILIVGQYLLSTMDASSSRLIQILYLLIAGTGVGCFIQVRVYAIQASVKRENIAIATSVSNFMFNLGGTVGIAVSGTIFNNMLKSKLPAEIVAVVNARPELIPTLPNSDFVLEQIAKSLGSVYYFTMPITGLVIIFALFVKEYQTDLPVDTSMAI